MFVPFGLLLVCLDMFDAILVSFFTQFFLLFVGHMLCIEFRYFIEKCVMLL